MNLDKRIV